MTVPGKDELLFLALGGAGEIGMNLNLYGHAGKWLMIDLGIGFADDTMPGVEVVMPDPAFIEERRADLLGIVLTHAHDDHVDAAGVTALPRHLPFFCQPEDLPELMPLGFTDMHPLPDAPTAWEELTVARTRGRHAHDDRMAAGLGPVSGVALSAPGEPAVLVADPAGLAKLKTVRMLVRSSRRTVSKNNRNMAYS